MKPAEPLPTPMASDDLLIRRSCVRAAPGSSKADNELAPAETAAPEPGQREERRDGLHGRSADPCAECGHAKAHHVACSLGALMGGIWGCLECDAPRGMEHPFVPATDAPRSLFDDAGAGGAR